MKKPLLVEIFNLNTPFSRVFKMHEHVGDCVDGAVCKETFLNGLSSEAKLIGYEPNILGSGGNGVCFNVSEKRVLKLTTDENEAFAANSIKGRKNKHVVNIKDVFSIKETNLYGIVQEKLKVLNLEEHDLFHNLAHTLREAKCIGSYTSPWVTSKGSFSRIQERALDNLSEEKYSEFLKLSEQFQFSHIVEELFNLGIEYLDFKPANLMKRNENYVIIDFGRTFAANSCAPRIF